MSLPPQITVATPIRHPRLRYVLDVIGNDLGYHFRYLNDRSVFPVDEPQYLVHYGGEGGIHYLPHHPLLAGKDAPLPFPPAPGADLLAYIFFVLSRYEEYGSATLDAHGRFPASASHALRHGYLERPVVREWTAAIGHQLRDWFPDLPAPAGRPLNFEPTYDIDLLWAFHHRGWRGVASGLRDAVTGKSARALARLRSEPDDDPFYTLPALEELHEANGLTATYFWLLADNASNHDPNPYPVPGAQIELMHTLGETAMHGIHPSYLASVSEGKLEQEKLRLEQILHHPITHSRQHFLRFRLPDTYRQLLAAGITHDHSMGYADRAGWRAGTNLPFAWYDLEREEATALIIHPFAAMDVTLKNYEGSGAGNAGAKILGIAKTVHRYGGPFPLLWHNSSFATAYGWEGWWEMYLKLVSALVELRTES